MLYKIIGDIDDTNFIEILDSVKKFNRIMCKNLCIYLALDSYKNLEQNEERVNNFIKIWQNKGVYIIKINENNLKNELPEIIEWCRDNFVRLEKEKYEITNQGLLEQMFNFLDLFEENLQKGGNNV